MGSLYDYFSNKEALVAALIERHAEEMVAVIESGFRSHADSPLPAAIRAWVESGVEAHLSNPELHKILVEQVPNVGDHRRLRGFEERVTRSVSSYLESRSTEIGPKDLPLVSFVVAQAVVSLTHRVVAERPKSLEDERLVEEVTALVLGYLAPTDDGQ